MVNGKERGKTFDTAERAHAYALAMRGEVQTQTWIDPSGGQTPYRDWHETWARQREAQVRPTTRAKEDSLSRNHVLPAFADFQLAAISVAAVQEWVAKLSRHLSAASVHSAFTVLRSSLDVAAKQRLIRASPCAGVRLPPIDQDEKQFLEPWQIAELVGQADERYRALVLLGCWGGLRFGELVALDRRHVDVAAGTVRVERTASVVSGHGMVIGAPKTTTSRRTVSIPLMVAKALSDHLDAFCGPSGSDPVFTGPKGARLDANNFRARQWKTMTRAVGLTGLRLHDMRHTAIALWISTGVPMLTVSRQAGHASTRVTENTYGHLFPHAGSELTSRLDALMVPVAHGAQNVTALRQRPA